MAKRRHQPTRCKICGVHMSEVPVSKRGYCFEHGLELRLANIEQLEARSGPFYDHWLRRCFLAARRELVAAEARIEQEQGVGSEQA